MAEIILLRRAALDVDEIEQDSIAKWGNKVASDYMDSLDKTLLMLSEHPHLLKKFGVSGTLFYYPMREHSLFCTLCHNVIYVLTVKYGGMNLEDLIQRIEPTLIDELEIMQAKLEARQNP